ncbi:hypothetical protein [Streptomyces chartreusis]|uniref:hypothetical protein n=1 Tax=Streptomyces chartreusis TaxID=1969 RepID=UPI00341BBCA3
MLKTFKRWHIITASLVLAAGLAVTGWLIVRPTYDDIVNDCIAALKDRPEGDKDKPTACKDVKEDDYTALLVSQVIRDEGWTDEEGNFDMGELLKDTP